MDLLHPVTDHEMQQAEALVGGLFEKMAGFISCEADIETLLIAGAGNLRFAAAIYRRTEAFAKAQANYDKFKADLEANVPPERRLVHSWFWLAHRIEQCQTGVDTIVTMTFCVPLVCEYLPAPQQPAQEQP